MIWSLEVFPGNVALASSLKGSFSSSINSGQNLRPLYLKNDVGDKPLQKCCTVQTQAFILRPEIHYQSPNFILDTMYHPDWDSQWEFKGDHSWTVISDLGNVHRNSGG